MNSLLELDLAAILRTTKLPMAVAEGLYTLISKGMEPDDCRFLAGIMKDNGWELRLLENDGAGCSESFGYMGEPEITRIEAKTVTVIWL